MKKIMFDTNIFDAILNSSIDIASFPKNCKYYVTHIQKDEIDAISTPEKQERKKQLLQTFEKINAENLPTESFILGKSRLGMAKLGNGGLLDELRKGNPKHTKDALIGETAIKKDLILVTEDTSNFSSRVRSLGGAVINFEEFKAGAF